MTEILVENESQQLWEILVDGVDEHDLFTLSNEDHRATAIKTGNQTYTVKFSDLSEDDAERLFNDINEAHLMVGNIKIMSFPNVSIKREPSE